MYVGSHLLLANMTGVHPPPTESRERLSSLRRLLGWNLILRNTGGLVFKKGSI
jgi:hypothetical protein